MANLKSKIVGALVGTMTGDALGMAAEGVPVGAVQARYGELREMVDGWQPAGHYTDDTEMMIGLAESLVECGRFDAGHAAARLAANFSPDRGYGGGAFLLLQRMQAGGDWQALAPAQFGGSGSFGNGAAMRMAPIGAFFHDDTEALVAAAEGSSRITHTHSLGVGGGVAQAVAVALAVRADPQSGFAPDAFLAELLSLTADYPDFQSYLRPVRELLTASPPRDEVIRVLGNGVAAHRSVPLALYAFLSHADSFEEAVVYAVNCGGDADTIGAMTGAIAGAYHGLQAIPQRWLERLEDGDKGLSYVKALGERLYAVKWGAAAGH